MDNWIEAGKIASKARNYGYDLLIEGAKLIDILEKVENYILENNGKPAFPPQISLNNIAAHYCSPIEDDTILKKGDIAKLDLGVHIEGAIADTAITREISTNTNKKLIQASEEALQEAIKLVKPGVELREIGKKINKIITSYGFNPIRNLSGHGIDRYEVHSGLTIPNYDNGDTTKLKENQVIALEPFATTGKGMIKEGKPSRIYRLGEPGPIRDNTSRQILEYIKQEFKTLPFCERQLLKKFKPFQIRFALQRLSNEDIIHQYTQLPEESDGIVSQTEHTIIVKEKSIVTTL